MNLCSVFLRKILFLLTIVFLLYYQTHYKAFRKDKW